MERQQLYALVWSKPMRTAAAECGISDVALAKQCRKMDVPVPPAYSDNVAQSFRLDVAHRSDLMSPSVPG